MNEIIKPGIVLLIITVIVSAALGVVSSVTAEPIRINKEKSDKTAMIDVMPSDRTLAFAESKIEVSDVDGINFYIEVYEGTELYGYVVSASQNGYGGAVEMFIGYDRDGVIKGVKIVSHSETPGLGANAQNPKFTDQYKQKSGMLNVVKGTPGDSDIAAITSATITSAAVTDGVNNASAFFETHLKGGAK